MTDLSIGTAKVRAVTHIHVDDLFGRYSYDIPTGSRQELDPQLAVLYGENGAGKTTILKLLHNSISPGPGRGHKTAILPVPFKMFMVRFVGGIELLVTRPESQEGDYTMSLKVNGRKQAQARFAGIEGVIPRKTSLSEEQDSFIAQLNEVLQLSSFFLGDERRLDSDAFEEEDEGLDPEYLNFERYQIALHERMVRRQIDRESQLLLALNRVIQWVRPQALAGVNTGSLNANTIYTDVVKRLSMEPELERSIEAQASPSDVFKAIEELEQRTANQARFSLTPRLETKDLLQALKQAPPDRRALIISTLQPYLDGIRARLDAMEGLYTALKAFTESLNSFLLDKSVTFDVRRGLLVRTADGSRLPPERLSSGEKQLLMLLCNLLISRQNPSLFLVDEPELSLNVKWQRKLIPALLTFTVDSQIQLLMATHSIELLSSYRQRVVRLPFGSE